MAHHPKHPEILLAVAWLCAMAASHAEYHEFDKAKDVQAAIQEVRWPYWAESTYNAIYSQDVSGSNGRSVYFYGGVPMASPGYPQSGSPPNIIWSFWPPHGTRGQAVKACFTGPNMYAPPHIGEGASGKVAGQWPSIHLNHWYRFATRLWKPIGNDPDVGYIGQWLRDPLTGEWHHYATMRLPFAPEGMTGLGGFLEDFYHGGRKPRRTDYRNVYYLRPGGWQSANHFTPSMRQPKEKGKAELIDNGTAACFESCFAPDYQGNLDFDRNIKAVTLEIKQAENPPFDPIVVREAMALTHGNQMMVKWSLPATSSPQLAYRIQVFDGPDATAAPRVEAADRDPEARQCRIDATGIRDPRVVLTITDIFDRTSPPQTATNITRPPDPAVSAPAVIPGLDFAYYEGTWTAMPDFAALAPVASGSVAFPDLTPRLRRQDYAFRFTGFLKVPVTGIHGFALRCCDGGQLMIDGKMVIDHDGVHSPSEKHGHAVLEAGFHAVDLRYFFREQSKEAGDDTDLIRVMIQAPGQAWQEIPGTAWSRAAVSGQPTVTLAGLGDGQTHPADHVPMKADVTGTEAPIEKVRFYVGDHVWGESTHAPYTLDAFLWNGPDNRLRARAYFANKRSVDSPIVRLTTTATDTAPWMSAGPSAHVQGFGARVANGKLDLIGDGLNILQQTVEGDCSLVARVADIHPAGPAPDGKHPDWSWNAGLILRQSLETTPGTPLGNEQHGYTAVFATVNEGTHFQDHTMANGGGPFWSKSLGKQRWLRLARHGDEFTTSVSADGNSWVVANKATLKNMPARLHAGVFTHAKESGNLNVHSASFDNVNLDGRIALPDR